MDMEEEEGTKVPTTGWSREIWVPKQVPRGHPVEERVCVENKVVEKVWVCEEDL